MNKWEIEVQKSLLRSEAVAIKALEAQYKQALTEVKRKVQDFQAEIDMLDAAASQDGIDDATRALLLSQKRSKIYQKQYQTALQGQISAILDKMHGDNYSTIQAYLKGSYESGYVGTMYDMAKQGVPVIVPIDQAAAVRAILTDSKVSKGLYNRLGVEVSGLKRSITQEISRGISVGMSYADIARNIANVSRAPLSRTMTITRTEGHRIQQASTVDAQQAAKAKGADVVKQWDATLDGNTRDSHRAVDGEIRELDEKFSNGLMYPGDPSGPASEVINCRCTSNTRARWALDEEELNILKERAEFFGLDKTDSFEDFKAKYLEASNNSAATPAYNVTATTQKLSASMGQTDYTDYKKLIESNPDIAKLYSKADQVSKIKLSANDGYYQSGSNTIVYSYPAQRYINNGMNKFGTLAHEYGHFFDSMVQYSTTNFLEVDTVNASCRYFKLKKVASSSDEFLQAMRADRNTIRAMLTAQVRADLKAHDASSGVQDAIDGLFGVRIGWGHGDKYYNRKYSHIKQMGEDKQVKNAYAALGMDASNQSKVKAIVRNYETASELWANMMSAETTGGEALDYIKKFFPETYKVFRNIIKGVL